MKRTIIDASQFELTDRVVAIKRVSKTVKGGRTMRFSALVVVARWCRPWQGRRGSGGYPERKRSGCQEPGGNPHG